MVLPSEPRHVCLFDYALYGGLVSAENLFKF